MCALYKMKFDLIFIYFIKQSAYFNVNCCSIRLHGAVVESNTFHYTLILCYNLFFFRFSITIFFKFVIHSPINIILQIQPYTNQMQPFKLQIQSVKLQIIPFSYQIQPLKSVIKTIVKITNEI